MMKKPAVNYYAIVTAIITAVLIFGYSQYILPTQTQKEDRNNVIAAQNIKDQLADYINSSIYMIDKEKNSEIDKNSIVDSIKVKCVTTGHEIIRISRVCKIKRKEKKLSEVVIDLKKFQKSIPRLSNFGTILIAEISSDNKVLYNQDIPLEYVDSLIKNNRITGTALNFKHSPWRFYNQQVTITTPKNKADVKLLISCGISQEKFSDSVKAIPPRTLVIALFCVIMVILSINFIKPLISSPSERFSQKDLVSVVFCIGVLIISLMAMFVVFGWDTTLRNKSGADLKQLNNTIKKSLESDFKYFTATIDCNATKNDKINDSVISLALEDSIAATSEKNSEKKKDSVNPRLRYLDEYFYINSNGNSKWIVAPETDNVYLRNYTDRDYFQHLTTKNTTQILTGVFSRENNRYQWIYAKSIKKSNEKALPDVVGVGYRNRIADSLNLPKDTDFLVVNSEGKVQMQGNTFKRLNLSLLNGNEHNDDFLSLLATQDSKYSINLTLKFQGTDYQAYAQKLNVKSDISLNVITLRKLTFTNSLLIFSFVNGVIISTVYGLFIFALSLLYCAVVYYKRNSFFSKHHFYYLFPNCSRTREYSFLIITNLIAIATGIITALLVHPSAAIYCCVIIGATSSLINFFLLTKGIQHECEDKIKLNNLLKTAVFIAIAAVLCIHFTNKGWVTAVIVPLVFLLHLVLLIIFRKYLRLPPEPQKAQQGNDNLPTEFDKKSYGWFITFMLFNHFGVFTFILCCSIYASELNTVTGIHCPEQKTVNLSINVYGCNCNTFPKIKNNTDEAGVPNSFLINRPTDLEKKQYNLAKSITIYYTHNGHMFTGYVVFVLYIVFVVLLFTIIYLLLGLYGNRFFFYDLMAVYRLKYLGNHTVGKFSYITVYPDKKRLDDTIENLDGYESSKFSVEENVTDDTDIIFWQDFIIRDNIARNRESYYAVWNSIHTQELIGNKDSKEYQRKENANKMKQNILYDFARDGFVNYKNKSVIMEFMTQKIIDCDIITGRLKLQNPNFGKFLQYEIKEDQEFIERFKTEGTSGSFSTLKPVLIIVAVGALIMLMYLNKDSYDKVAIFGTTITAAIGTLDKLLGFYKS